MESSSHNHMAHHSESQPWWRGPANLALIGFLLIGGFFLITEHTAHVLGALPWLLLLACPFMHLFMHHGHGGHGARQPTDDHAQTEKEDQPREKMP